MFFDDLGCFEIESQSFTRLTPSAREFENLLTGKLTTPTILNDCSGNVNSTVTTTKAPAKSRGSRSKALLKKRANSLALDVNQPKPRTPRRKLNCGNAFEDFDTQYSTSTHCFSSVGTPSNFSAEMSRMWGGTDLDFASAASYVDTFLDLPTPKSAEMPSTSRMTQHQSNMSQYTECPENDLDQPKLIRTTSIEQEGLSHFFEQATLDGGWPATSCNSSPPGDDSESYVQQLHISRTPHMPIKKNQLTSNPYGQAAMGAVDEYFGKVLPSPLGIRRNSLLSASAPASTSSGGGNHQLHRLLSSTPRGGTCSSISSSCSYLRTPHGATGEYNFDHKNMPEFETLLDEYKFTDIDQELDSFYLDTIESFSGELDLISN